MEDMKIILAEIRDLRKDIKTDIKEIREDIKSLNSRVWKIESRIWALSIVLGIAGGKISQYIPFLN